MEARFFGGFALTEAGLVRYADMGSENRTVEHLETTGTVIRTPNPRLHPTGGRLAQLVRALARQARGQWFESTVAHHSPLPGLFCSRNWDGA